jgi:hypothetical protein
MTHESKARRAWWRSERERASTPNYTIEEAGGHSWVALSGARVAGPMTNAEAWRWIDRQATAKRYGQARCAEEV